MLLDDLTAGTAAPATPTPPRGTRRKSKPTRTTVIPKTSNLDVTPPRVNTIYNELLSLNAEQYPNACSVLLRVFIELSVDHFIVDKQLMDDNTMRNTALAKRLKTVVGKLEKSSDIPAQLARAMEQLADGNRTVAATIPTFNLYVHNPYVFPRASELYTTWDEIAPLLEKVWP